MTLQSYQSGFGAGQLRAVHWHPIKHNAGTLSVFTQLTTKQATPLHKSSCWCAAGHRLLACVRSLERLPPTTCSAAEVTPFTASEACAQLTDIAAEFSSALHSILTKPHLPRTMGVGSGGMRSSIFAVAWLLPGCTCLTLLGSLHHTRDHVKDLSFFCSCGRQKRACVHHTHRTHPESLGSCCYKIFSGKRYRVLVVKSKKGFRLVVVILWILFTALVHKLRSRTRLILPCIHISFL